MEREGVTERHAPPRTPPLVGGGVG
jgi:hypothetical protein